MVRYYCWQYLPTLICCSDELWLKLTVVELFVVLALHFGWVDSWIQCFKGRAEILLIACHFQSDGFLSLHMVSARHTVYGAASSYCVHVTLAHSNVASI